MVEKRDEVRETTDAPPPQRSRYRRSIMRLRSASMEAYPLWRGRLLFLVGGIGVGLAAVLMAKGADLAQDGFRRLTAPSPLIALVLTPAGFALAALLALTVFPNSQGSGIPQVIAARHARDAGFRYSADLAARGLRQGAGPVPGPVLRCLGGPRGADRAGRRRDHGRLRPPDPRAPARAPPRGRRRRRRGGLQHAARRHRVRHRGTGTRLRGALLRPDRGRDRGRGPDLARAPRQLYLFRDDRRRPAAGGRLDRPARRRRRRPRGRPVQPLGDPVRPRPARRGRTRRSGSGP